MPELRPYVDRQGRNFFARWLDRLDNVTEARVFIALSRLEQGSSAAKGVSEGVMEWRMDFGPGYRVYFGKDGEAVIILLGGGTKQRQHLDNRFRAGALARVQATEEGTMTQLTKPFSETLREHLQRKAGFRKALLQEAVGCMVAGDVETGKSVLRQYINGTVGFIKLGADLGRSPKVLMRMFSATGNPQARNLFEIVAHLQKLEGTVLEVVSREAA